MSERLAKRLPADARVRARPPALLAIVSGVCACVVNAAPPAHVVTTERTAPVAPPSVEATRPGPVAIVRRDIVVGNAGATAALLDAGLSRQMIDQLDAAFVSRIDVFAHLSGGNRISLWTQDELLVAAKVNGGGAAPIFVVRYSGPLAPSSYYDANGDGMVGAILARPVPLSRITSRFGARFDAIAGRRAEHHGIDYGVPIGTPVVAVGAGRVKTVASSPTAGNFVVVTHAQGYESRYLHLSAFDRRVRSGATVTQGQVLGKSGNTGRSTGPHLHYELRVAGIPLDPLATLPIPAVSLGPMARREHLAFLKQLEAVHDGRTDEQDEHPRARP